MDSEFDVLEADYRSAVDILNENAAYDKTASLPGDIIARHMLTGEKNETIYAAAEEMMTNYYLFIIANGAPPDLIRRVKGELAQINHLRKNVLGGYEVIDEKIRLIPGIQGGRSEKPTSGLTGTLLPPNVEFSLPTTPTQYH